MTDTWTDQLIDGQTGWQMDRQMDRPTVLKTDRPIDKWMGG